MGHGHSHSHTPLLDGKHTVSDADAAALRRVTLAAMMVSLALVALKSGGWAATNATSLLSSLADSLFDVLISGMNFIAVRYAIKPADEQHRYGHTGIEDIAGLVQFAFICGSMLLVAAQAVQQFFSPHPITAPEYGIGVMLISLGMTTMLVLYQRRVVRRTGSLIVQADALHYLSDILMNSSIILSLFLALWFDWRWLDPLLALLISVYVIREAVPIGKRAFNNLMNKEMPEQEKATILAIVEAMPEIQGYHHLRTRYAGAKPFIQLHINIARETPFEAAHAIADRLEQALLAAFPGADIIIHQDPV